MNDKKVLKEKLESVLRNSSGSIDQKVKLIDKTLTNEERSKYIFSIDPFKNSVIIIENE